MCIIQQWLISLEMIAKKKIKFKKKEIKQTQYIKALEGMAK